MIAVDKFRHSDFRKKMTDCILEMLAQLAEADRNIFVWKHYHGYQVELIAKMLGQSCAEVETTLGAINSILCQKIRCLLAEDPHAGAETNLHDGVTLEEAGGGGNVYDVLSSGFKGHNLPLNLRSEPMAPTFL